MSLLVNSCFMCRNPISALAIKTENLCEEQPEGNIFNFICELFNLQCLVKLAESYGKIDNVEFCVSCLARIQNAMDTCAQMQYLEVKLKEIKKEMQNTILSSYGWNKRDDPSIETPSVAERYGRLMSQCWSQCKVCIPRYSVTLNSVSVEKIKPRRKRKFKSRGEDFVEGEDIEAVVVDVDAIEHLTNSKELDIRKDDNDSDEHDSVYHELSDDSHSGDKDSGDSSDDEYPPRNTRTKSKGKQKTAQSLRGKIHPENLRYFCRTCKEGFSQRQGLRIHCNKVHGEDVLTTCVFCGHDLNTNRVSSPEEEELYKCERESCTHTFKKMTEMRKHHEFKCKANPAPGLRIGSLSGSEESGDEKPASASSSFICRKCEKGFTRRKYLKIHYLKEHGQDILCLCSHCGLDFSINQGDSVEQAEEPDDFRYKCAEVGCTRAFRTMAQIRKHHEAKCLENPKVRDRLTPNYKCDQCGKAYVQATNLRYHIANVHEKTFKFCCEICGRGFQIQSWLENHKRYVHTSEKRVECEICNMKFKRPQQLFYHRRLHTGERPHVCEFCGKAFARPEKLNTHKRNMHSSQQFPCPECGKCFKSVQYVRNHVASFHRRVVYQSQLKKRKTATTNLNDSKGSESCEGNTPTFALPAEWGFMESSRVPNTSSAKTKDKPEICPVYEIYAVPQGFENHEVEAVEAEQFVVP